MTDGLVDVEVLVSRRMSTIKGTIEHTGNELPADTVVVAFSTDSSQWVPLSTVVARVSPDNDAILPSRDCRLAPIS